MVFTMVWGAQDSDVDLDVVSIFTELLFCYFFYCWPAMYPKIVVLYLPTFVAEDAQVDCVHTNVASKLPAFYNYMQLYAVGQLDQVLYLFNITFLH